MAKEVLCTRCFSETHPANSGAEPHPPGGLGLEDLTHAILIQKENKYPKIKTVQQYPSTEVSHGIK